MPRIKTACPICTSKGEDRSGDNLLLYESGKGGYCFKCAKTIWLNNNRETQINSLNTKTQASELDIQIITQQYPILGIPSRGISKETCERYQVRSSVDEVTGEQDAVYYPYYNHDGHITGYKKRKLPKLFGVLGKPSGLFGQFQCKKGAKFLIIVEGEHDCLSTWEMLSSLGKNYNVVSLPNGANTEGSIDRQTLKELEWITSHETVAIMLDNDEPGKATALSLADQLASQVKVGIVSLPLKDAGEMLQRGMTKEFFKALQDAKPYRPDSIVEGSTINIEDLMKAKEPGIELPYPGLQKKTWGLRKAEITLVTAGCVDADTECLTPEGWKKISEIDPSNNEHIMVFDPRNGVSFFDIPDAYVVAKAEELTHFHTKYGVDQVLSDEHTVPYINRGFNNILTIPFAELKSRHEKSNDGWQGRFITSFNYSGNGIALSEGDLRLQVAVIADGRIVKEGKNNYTQMRFRKKRKYERLLALCKKFGLPFRDMTKPGGEYDVIVWPKYQDKEFTPFYFECSQEQLRIILDEAVHWDGCEKKGTFFSSKKQSADFIQFAYSATGKRATISTDNRVGKVSYVVIPSPNTLVGITNKEQKIEMKKYKTVDGKKYCFTTSTGMWIARRNNKIFVTGNSGIGKSTFTREIGYHLAKQGYRVATIGLETVMEDSARYYIAMDNNVPAYRLMFNPQCIPREDYERSFKELISSNKMHFFKHWGSIDSDDLIRKCQYFAKALECDFIILDHISMVVAGQQSKDERKDIDTLFEALARLVVETGVGVIAVMHLKRAQGKSFNHGDEVELSDLRGCVDKDTEYLTPQGWKKISEFREDDIVMEVDKDLVGKFVKPVEFVKLPCEEGLTHIRTNRLDMMLSDEHRILYHTEKNENDLLEITVEEALKIHEQQATGFRGRIPCVLNGVSSPTEHVAHPMTEAAVRVHVMFSADGWMRNPNTRRCSVRVKKERKKERARQLLSAYSTDWYEFDIKGGYTEFTFQAPLEKGYQGWFNFANNEILSWVADEAKHWDGELTTSRLTSINKDDADFIQFAYTTDARRTAMRYRERTDSFGGKYNAQDQYIVSPTNETHVSFRKAPNSKVTIERVPSPDGFKYCFVTSTGGWLARRNGKIFVTGNSAGAEQMSFNVWALERDQQGEQKDLVRIRVLKNRLLGFTGLADTLLYRHDTGRMEVMNNDY